MCIGRDIDVFARNPLWQRGLDYNHGTGHGIAYFINVHEGSSQTVIIIIITTIRLCLSSPHVDFPCDVFISNKSYCY